MTSVVVVEDEPDMRLLVGVAIRHRAGIELVAEAESGADAIRHVTDCQPDVVILDLGLPDIAADELLPRMRAASRGSKIVIFTGNDVLGAAAATADGFVTKAHDITYLLDLVEQLGATDAFVAHLDVVADPNELRRVRAFAVERLREWDCEEELDDAELLVSELATNAVVHAGTPYRVTVRRRLQAVRFEVADRSPAVPQPRLVSEIEEGGRGMHLVSALSTAWGVDPTADGKVVWAEIPCDLTARAPFGASGPAAIGA